MTALLVVDVQKDFLPGGALGVAKGDEVIPPILQLLSFPFDLVVASKDHHPPNHGSFAETHGKKPGEHVKLKNLDQILWPAHCVRNTPGAELSHHLPPLPKVFHKGTDPEYDSYSAFFDNGHVKSTGLSDYLSEHNITDLYIAGLTTDYCVKYSALDAVNLGFNTHIVIDACRPVNLEPQDEEHAISEMVQAGAEIVTTADVQARLQP